MNKKLWTIIAIGVAIRLLWAFMRWEWLQVTVCDDAFYYFVIAKTIIAKGMVSADGVTLTNGFHPLWLVTVLPIWLFSQGIVAIRTVMVLATVIDTVTVLILWRLLKPFGKETALWGAAFYFLNPVVITQVMSGMETPAVALMGVLWIYVVTRWKFNWIGLVGGLLFLARTDMAFIILAGHIYLWMHNRMINWDQIGISALVVSPWLFWNIATFGTIFQSSGSVYPWIHYQNIFVFYGMSFFSSPFVYGEIVSLAWGALRNIGVYWGGVVILITLIVLALQRKDWRVETYHNYTWALLGMLAMILFHTLIRWQVRIWYFHLLFIITLFWGIPVIVSWSRKWRTTFIIVCCVAWIHILGNIPDSIGFFARMYVMQKRAVVASEMVNRLPAGAIVGAWNSGYPQYFAADSITVINLDGLVNNEVLSYYRRGALWEYLYKMRIEFIVDNSAYVDMFGRYISKEERESKFIEVLRIDDIGIRGNNMLTLFVDLGDRGIFDAEKKE